VRRILGAQLAANRRMCPLRNPHQPQCCDIRPSVRMESEAGQAEEKNHDHNLMKESSCPAGETANKEKPACLIMFTALRVSSTRMSCRR
jgi:hypothetical protein